MGAVSRAEAALYLAWPNPGHTSQVPSKGGAGHRGPGMQGGAPGGCGSRKGRRAWTGDLGTWKKSPLGVSWEGVGGVPIWPQPCNRLGTQGGSSWWRPGSVGAPFGLLCAEGICPRARDGASKGRCVRPRPFGFRFADSL